jgi:hypothetical protein
MIGDIQPRGMVSCALLAQLHVSSLGVIDPHAMHNGKLHLQCYGGARFSLMESRAPGCVRSELILR